jgi:hypothetical protein
MHLRMRAGNRVLRSLALVRAEPTQRAPTGSIVARQTRPPLLI